MFSRLLNTPIAHESFLLTQVRAFRAQARRTAVLRRPTRSQLKPVGISITVNPHLPKLAWRGVVDQGRIDFTVGPAVEVRPEGFFEGVWDGSFKDLYTAASGYSFGSGVYIRDGWPLVIPPKHPLEHIYVLRDKRTGVDYVSNSVAYCLSSAGLTPGSSFSTKLGEQLLERTNRQTMVGNLRYSPRSVRSQRFELLTIFHDNFRISAGGEIFFDQPFLGQKFRSFDDYRRFLAAVAKRLVLNAADPTRFNPLAPIASISQGYDSPAVAAVVTEAGCSEAVTMSIKLRGYDDSGSDVARQLGLVVYEVEHPLGAELHTIKVQLKDHLAEMALEFVATAGAGDDFCFAAMEDVLSDRLFFSGAWGDSIWKLASDVPNGLPVRVKYGKSLGEFRLRVGFAHVPLPFAGGFHSASIKRVSRRSEMAPFSVGGDYDRPIARRIAEEAGIGRGSFARAKSAANPNVTNRPALWRRALSKVMARYSS